MPLLRSWEKSISTGCYKDVAPTGLQSGSGSANSNGIQNVERWDLATGPARVQGCLISAFSFASAAAISSQDGARQAWHGVPARIMSSSALHRAAAQSEPVPL